jgi:hypothetical protein
MISVGTSLGNVNLEKTSPSRTETTNRQIYLGYASIYGDGPHSILEASAAEFKKGIPLASQTEIVDFYIEFNMTCDGLADKGTIGLGISIDGKNVSDPNIDFAVTETRKNGTFTVENVEVKRGNVLSFAILVIYRSPTHPNLINVTGAGGFLIPFSKSTSWLSWVAIHPLLNLWIHQKGRISILDCLQRR